MYRVIIVEDEAVLRKGLVNFVPWEEMGFEVGGAFRDGEEAYIWLMTNSCDVILTDIMMGKMDGLEFAKRIHEEAPDKKIIFLSGYADFSNARTAMQYGVKDFLEKPVDDAELAEAFGRIKAELDDAADKEQLDNGEVAVWSQLLVLEIDSGSNASIGNVLREYMGKIMSLPLQAIQKNLEKLCYRIAREYGSRGIDVWSATNERYNILEVYRQQDCKSLYDCVFEMLLALKAGAGDNTGGTDDYIIERIKRYIKNHQGEDISNATIAEAHKLHPVYMGKIFREQTGMTLSEYILKIRMERACELLKKKKYSVGEIGCMVGYNTHYYFSVVFKKYTGFTPTEYRDKVTKA